MVPKLGWTSLLRDEESCAWRSSSEMRQWSVYECVCVCAGAVEVRAVVWFHVVWHGNPIVFFVFFFCVRYSSFVVGTVVSAILSAVLTVVPGTWYEKQPFLLR